MKNEIRITKKEMMSWAKEYHIYGAVNIIFFSAWVLMGLFGITGLISLSVFTAKGVEFEFFIWYAYAFFLLISVYKLFVSRFIFMANHYKTFSKMYGVTEWLRTVEFADEDIILTDHTSVTKILYGNIKKIKENKNTVMILLNNNSAIRLYKDRFVEGSWEECKEKINSKMK